MKIFVTGACGYKGHVLIPKLLQDGHDVVGFDTEWFGNFHDKNDKLKTVKGDIRDSSQYDLKGFDAVIHLSSIANDPCGDLNPKLTWETSALATMKLADEAKRAGVKQFIYASSGSVYGIKDEYDVVEDLPLEPISEYNKTKMVSERALLSYADDMIVQIIRPATVCGLSPRMRLDVSVNLLTMQALTKGKITVFGGKQTRPNIHIDDITDCYLHFLHNPQLRGIYNAGFENISILDIANMICEFKKVDIDVTESQDPRSYRMNSDKILATGFKPKKDVGMAIKELIHAFQAGQLNDEPRWYNLEWMTRNNLSQ